MSTAPERVIEFIPRWRPNLLIIQYGYNSTIIEMQHNDDHDISAWNSDR